MADFRSLRQLPAHQLKGPAKFVVFRPVRWVSTWHDAAAISPRPGKHHKPTLGNPVGFLFPNPPSQPAFHRFLCEDGPCSDGANQRHRTPQKRPFPGDAQGVSRTTRTNTMYLYIAAAVVVVLFVALVLRWMQPRRKGSKSKP